MSKPMIRLAVLGICAMALTACGGRGDLRPVEGRDISDGPDEFRVLPAEPLIIPETLGALPEPGGASRAARNPRGEAIAALGGNPAAEYAGGIPAADAALIAAVTRYGTDPQIRSLLTGGGGTIDPYAEVRRLRALGVATPSAPPG